MQKDLINIKDNDSIASVAKVKHEEEEDGSELDNGTENENSNESKNKNYLNLPSLWMHW